MTKPLFASAAIVVLACSALAVAQPGGAAQNAQDEARLKAELDARWEQLQAQRRAAQNGRAADRARYEQGLRDYEAARQRYEADLARSREEAARYQAEVARSNAARAEYERQMAERRARQTPEENERDARIERQRQREAAEQAEREARRARRAQEEAAEQAERDARRNRRAARERDRSSGEAEAAAAAPAPAASNRSCEDQRQRNRRRGRGVGNFLGGVAGLVGGPTSGAAGVLSHIVPVGALIGEAIASLLDCDEQEKAAAATERAAERGSVGSTETWTSETRPGVTGSSTVTAVQNTPQGEQCMTVTDVVIVDGEETRAPKRMCRRPPSNRYVRV